MMHALTLLLITLFFGRWAALIPLATLAAILVVVAYHMSEWRTFGRVARAPRAMSLVLLTTFLLTVLVDLTVAIEVGMVLAAFLFMRRMAEVTNVTTITRELDGPERAEHGRVGRALSSRGPAGGRGVRDQRPVLLRRGGGVQECGRAGGQETRRAHRPHAPCARHGCDGTSCPEDADPTGSATIARGSSSPRSTHSPWRR